MDVEAILTRYGWRVLEIDARFPSQTPVTVYLSTGVNLAMALETCFLDGMDIDPPATAPHESCLEARQNP